MKLKVSQKEAIIVLARGAFELWLRVHGKLKRPEMTKKQALELRECFELIDSDGSGAIAADEVPLAFTVLGMNVKRQEIEAAVEEFNKDKPIDAVRCKNQSLHGCKQPKALRSMTVEMTDREKKRARAATLKNPMYIHPKPKLSEPDVPSYVVDSVSTDVKEPLLGEKRNDLIKAALDSKVKFVPPTNKSIEIDKPILSRDGSGKVLTKAYLEDKLGLFRTDLRHKEAKKAQIVHVQAVKTLRDFYDKGAWQVKGSPLLYPASRRPSIR